MTNPIRNNAPRTTPSHNDPERNAAAVKSLKLLIELAEPLDEIRMSEVPREVVKMKLQRHIERTEILRNAATTIGMEKLLNALTTSVPYGAVEAADVIWDMFEKARAKPAAVQPDAPVDVPVARQRAVEITAIDTIQASAPVDAKLVGYINALSTKILAKNAGKGENFAVSLSNLLDMLMPVAVSLLPTPTDSPAAAREKASSLDLIKKSLGGTHLSDADFVLQMQTIHAHLARFKDVMSLSTAIAVDSTQKMSASAAEAARRGYGTTLSSLPLGTDPQAATQALNVYIEDKTTIRKQEGGLSKVVKEGLKDVLDADFVMGADAIAVSTFTGNFEWKSQFHKDDTQEGTVTSADGSTQKLPLMKQTSGESGSGESRRESPEFPTAVRDGIVYAKLDYVDAGVAADRPSRLYRIVGVPLESGAERHQALSGLLKNSADKDVLSGLAFYEEPCEITLPKGEIESTSDSVALLEDAGIPIGQVSFPLLESGGVQFSKGIHKGKIEDMEEGTIVQFVSAGGFESVMTSSEPKVVKADVPYYNAICVELPGRDGRRTALKVAEWTVESFADVKQAK